MVMPLAIALSSSVLPAFGGETIRPRWPLPIGATRLSSRVERMFGVRFEIDQLEREDRRQRIEVRPAPRNFGIDAVDRLDAEQAEELLVVLRRAHLAGDAVARAKAEAANLRLRT